MLPYPTINTCKGNVKKRNYNNQLLTLFYGYIDKKWDFVSFSVSIKTVQVEICTVNNALVLSSHEAFTFDKIKNL